MSAPFFFTNANPFNIGGTLTYQIQISTDSDFSTVASSVSDLLGSGGLGTGQTGWTVDRDLTGDNILLASFRAVEVSS